jgi:Ca2+-binding RTX toxin-like protein
MIPHFRCPRGFRLRDACGQDERRRSPDEAMRSDSVVGATMATFTGTSSNDVITYYSLSAGVTAAPPGSMPSAGADTINGLGGDDRLNGGGGNDTVHGGDGNDAIWADVRDTGGANDATISAYGDGGNDDVYVTYFGNDTGEWEGDAATGSLLLRGGGGNDEIGIFCGPSVWVDASGTTSKIYGDGGDDRLWATALDPNSDGSFYPGNNAETLYGGAGNDEYFVLEAKDVVVEKPEEGVDTVVANQTDYALPANTENLTMRFNQLDYPDPNVGWTGTGNDVGNVITGSYNMVDWLYGLGGDDTIYGGTGDVTDVLRGGDGNDKIYGGESADDRADGPDTINGDAGNDDVWAGGGDDTVQGAAGNDNLYGQSGNDTLRGGDGSERVYGGTGNDTLYGDNGADAVRGGEGLDRLYGGQQQDRFEYTAAADSGPGVATRDVIFDFEEVGSVYGDRVDLAGIDAKTGVSGNQAFAFIGTAAFTGAGQVRATNAGTDTLIQANTGGSLEPELEVAVQDGQFVQPGQWAAADFIL